MMRKHIRKLIQRIEAPALRAYRHLRDPPPPNLVGDRDVEYSWVASHMPSGPGHALDFGCASSHMGLIAAARGYDVTAIDLCACQWHYKHSRIHFQRISLFDFELAEGSLDLVINCSTVEHVGLGRYGDDTGNDGDLQAMQRLRRWMKVGATMLLTVPVGRDAVVAPLHRIYGEQRLPALTNDFELTEQEYWSKDDENDWIRVPRSEALDRQGDEKIYGLGCLVLVRR